MMRFKRTSVFIIVVLILLTGGKLIAQAKAPYESISIAEGLSQGMVFDIIQDRDGFIWVATKNGLNRYDGYEFKVFTNDPYNSSTLSSNTIRKLFEDSKGRIWAGTEDAGLNILDKKTGKFYRILHDAANPSSLSGNSIRLIEELPDGRILVAADGPAFNVINLPEGFSKPGMQPLITRLTLPNNVQVYGMGKDRNGTMWLGGMDGSVFSFDPTKNSFLQLKTGALFNNGYLTQDGSILINHNLFLADGKAVYPLFDTKKTAPGNIIFRSREKLWENHHREINYYDVAKWEPGKAVQWTLKFSEAARLIYPFMIDRAGMLWSGSVGYGLRKYNTAGRKFRHQLPGFSVRWIVPDKYGIIFLGNFAYDWCKLSKDSIDHQPFKKFPQFTQVDNFTITRTGQHWVKTDNLGYFQYQPIIGKLTAHKEIDDGEGVGEKQPILEDSRGNVWFPGQRGVFVRLHSATGKIDSLNININAAMPMLQKAFCTALYEDKQGVIWVGTQEGFAKIVFKAGANSPADIKWYYNSINNRNSLNYNHVSCFLDDPLSPEKYLWISTKGGGLNRFDKTSGDFVHLTSKAGLPDDVVYGILPDDA
ncbi:MAG: two-component regulator propeller domain-containing protein, partial [Ginsengibacter sp.]